MAKLLKHHKFFITLEEMFLLTKFTHFKDDNLDSSQAFQNVTQWLKIVYLK